MIDEQEIGEIELNSDSKHNPALVEQLADTVERHFNAWRESLTPEQLSKLDTNPDFVAELKQVWEASDYVVQSCLRDPILLYGLLESGDLHTSFPAGTIESRLCQNLEQVTDEEALHKILRVFRREQMVRIIWRDIARTAPLSETLEDLSALADACVEQALDLLYQWAVDKHGVPRDADGVQQRMLVLGLGKLGARELNLSSDIDLIFAYPRSGEVEGGRYLSNEQFFTRLGQQLIKAIGSQTADGFVFRVDTRLRPFGDSGPLVMSYDAMEEYYFSQAREWERYAMIKARLVAGDDETVMEMLRPFVYRRYLDYGAIESIRDMKRMIRGEMHKRGMDANIKLGRGGIREIEFVGQAFQLVRGGRDPDLQIRPIMQVLDRLQQKELLPDYVVEELQAAYEFLRLVENRLQAWQDRQTHLLPDEPLEQLRLARSMGFEDWNGFYAALEQYRQRVQGHFAKVFAAPQAEQEQDEQADSALYSFWRQQLDSEQAIDVLAEAGFKEEAGAAYKMLEDFRNSHACRGQGQRGQQRLDQLMPILLEAVVVTEEPVTVLERLLRLMESIARRTAYLALLVENPMVLSQLVRLESASPWIASRITRHPILLDDLLDPRQLYSPLKRDALEAELDALLSALDEDDTEEQMERLRQFLQSNKLRVAAADITEVIPLMVVSDYLTEIAETIVSRVLEHVWAYMVSRHGKPSGLNDVQDKGFVVLAYGKMGGIELGYGSDLDMVFLHANSDYNSMTDGERQIGADLFFARLGQRMIHMLTTRTHSGQLYEVDMRLRPSGASGMLVSSLKAFEEYQHNQAWTWEHQALLRARPVAGDPVVASRFEETRRAVLSQERDPDKLRAEVVEMREKMRDSLDKSNKELFDLKQGVGGIADIEFMVQYAVLRWANVYPDLLDWTDNIRLLEGLARHDIFTGDVAEALANAYRAFRSASHRLALQEKTALVSQEKLVQEREQVKGFWDSLMIQQESN